MAAEWEGWLRSIAASIRYCEESASPVGRIFEAGLLSLPMGPSGVEKAIEDAGSREVNRTVGPASYAQLKSWFEAAGVAAPPAIAAGSAAPPTVPAAFTAAPLAPAAARTDANMIPHILECARAYCTLYEIRAAMEDVFGAYREPVFF